MQHLRYDILPSTNSLLMEKLSRSPEEIANGSIVSCGFQGAGRGQAGNSWESAAGANALFSIALRQVDIPAIEHFAITQILALCLCDYLSQLPCFQSEAAQKALRIKWPNDIYFGDKKLAGILIETRLAGSRITDCVCGIGLNIHQEVFLSDAPNPISIKTICREYRQQAPPEQEQDIKKLIEDIAGLVLSLSEAYKQGKISRQDLQKRYMSRLYRLNQWHGYCDEQGLFEGRILDVLPEGLLQIERKDKAGISLFAFKEIKFVL